MSQHARRNWAAKSEQHVAHNIVAMCCVEMLRSFDRRLQMQEPTIWGYVKPRANYRNISTQQIPTLYMLARNLQAPAKRSQHFSPTYRNIVGRNMLHAYGHPVATCCNMLGVENQTSAHARVQQCCTNLAKRLQHHVTTTNIA